MTLNSRALDDSPTESERSPASSKFTSGPRQSPTVGASERVRRDGALVSPRSEGSRREGSQGGNALGGPDEVSGVRAAPTDRQRRHADGFTGGLAEQSYEAQAFGDVGPKGPCVGLPDEMDRVRLIGELSRILHEPTVPEPMRHAGLMLIGWLARRMPGEASHSLGVTKSGKRSKRS